MVRATTQASSHRVWNGLCRCVALRNAVLRQLSVSSQVHLNFRSPAEQTFSSFSFQATSSISVLVFTRLARLSLSDTWSLAASTDGDWQQLQYNVCPLHIMPLSLKAWQSTGNVCTMVQVCVTDMSLSLEGVTCGWLGRLHFTLLDGCQYLQPCKSMSPRWSCPSEGEPPDKWSIQQLVRRFTQP